MDESNPRSEEGFVLVEEPSQPDSTNLEPPNSLEDGVQTVVGTAGTPDPSNPSVLATSKPMATESFEMSGSADIGRARKRPPAHYKYKQPSEDEERLEKLFRDLDVTKDGRVDVKDLTQGLKNMGIPLRQSDAIDMVRQGDQNASGDLDFAEFLHYMVEHEKRLKLVFSALDRNHDGRLDKAEIMTSFKELGITLSETEAVRLLARIDRDGSLDISFKEWRDFLLFHPSGDIRSILAYWSHPPILDIGEAIDVPEDFTEGELSSGLWWRHLVAGGLAGAVSRTATAPLDRLKVFLQVHGVKQFGTLRGCMRHMVLEGGIAGLWRGNGVNILKIAPESALKFMAYEQTKRFIRGEQPRDMFIYERLVAGSFAGAFSQSVIYPLEVLKTRLALRKTGEFRGILDAAFKIYSKEGVRSFYRGYVPNLIGIMPYAGIELAVYETLKGHFMAAHPGHDPGVSTALICATTSSTCGQVCAYPFALIRTKLQAQAVQINVPSGPGGAAASTAAAATASAHPATMREVVRHTLQNEGWTGLYRGIVPNFLKVLPAVSISFVVYEKSRAALGVTMT